jgi:hypothetical protein
LKTKASSLYTAYNNCLDTLKKREIEFRQLERATLSEHLAKWLAMDDTPRKDGKQIKSVHIARYKKGFFIFSGHYSNCKVCFSGPPTQAKAYKALLATEMQAELSGSGIVGPAHFINGGLWLERDQWVEYALV